MNHKGRVVGLVNNLCSVLKRTFSTQSAIIKTKITSSIVQRFSQISGDTNPLHIDKQFASNSIFKQRISHGMLPMCFLQQYFDKKQLKIKTIDIKFIKPIYLQEDIYIQVKEFTEQGVTKFSAQTKKVDKNNSNQGILVTSINGSVQQNNQK